VDIRNDIDNILGNPESVFCIGCNAQCQSRYEPYHIDLKMFTELSFLPPQPSTQVFTAYVKTYIKPFVSWITLGIFEVHLLKLMRLL